MKQPPPTTPDAPPATVPAASEAALAEARAQELRRIAHELFSRKGLGVPLSEVAKAAGVGVATLYRRYRDKDILILDVYREHMSDGENFAVQANSYPDPWEGMQYFLHRCTEQLMADRGMRELILGGYVGGAGWARSSSHAELLAGLDAMEDSITGELEHLVARAKAAGIVRSDFQHTDLRLMTAMANAAVPMDARGTTDRSERALSLLIEGIRPRL